MLRHPFPMPALACVLVLGATALSACGDGPAVPDRARVAAHRAREAQPVAAQPLVVQLSRDDVVVQPDGVDTVVVTVTRPAGYTGAVTVRLRAVPAGVRAAAVTLAAGVTSAPVVLHGDTTLLAGTTTDTLVAVPEGDSGTALAGTAPLRIVRVRTPRPAPAPALTSSALTGLAEPALPQELPVSSTLAVTGTTRRAATTSELWAAIRAAVPGDQILLTPGARYVGWFNLPRKSGAGFVTIRTDLPESELPAGVRVTPARAARFAKIVAQGRNDPAIRAMPGARGWRFVGVEITVHDTVQTLATIVMLGDNSARVTDSIPGDIILDRTYVHGLPHQGITRCIMLNSGRTAVMNSTVTECHRDGFDSNAIGSVSSPGPVRIENNRIEGAGMGIFVGGSDPRVPNLSPSDFVIRNNHITRPTAWKGVYTVKNLLEFKHMKRALVEGNVFESNWRDAQSGMAILFKSTNQQNTAPWSTTQDVTFRSNVIRNSSNGISIHASPETYPVVPTARIKIENNLFYNIGSYNGTTGGRMIVLGGELQDVQFLNNTMVHNSPASHAAISDPHASLPATDFVARNNIMTGGTSGWMTSSIGQGTRSLTAHWGTTWSFLNNAFLGSTFSSYPTTTRWLASVAAAGFVDPSVGNYALASTSPLRGTGVGGSDPGANVVALRAHAARVTAQ